MTQLFNMGKSATLVLQIQIQKANQSHFFVMYFSSWMKDLYISDEVIFQNFTWHWKMLESSGVFTKNLEVFFLTFPIFIYHLIRIHLHMVSSTVRFYHIPRVNEDPKISILSDMRRYIIHISQNVPEKVNGVII